MRYWRRGYRRRGWLLLLLMVLAVVSICLTISMRPLIRELAKAKVENRAQYIINEAVETMMESGEIDYENIIFLEKDVNGNITALKTNIAEVNRLKTHILAVVDTMLLDLDVNEVGLPLGSVILPTFLSGSGPKLPVKVLSISNSDAEYRNVFSEAGINQTAHQIMMDIIIDMTILTPVGTESVQAVSSVVVAETVIVGNVPQSYVSVGG